MWQLIRAYHLIRVRLIVKTYLEVPFGDSGLAKAKGARFDLSRKCWYCPDGVDLMKFSRWLPKNVQKFYKRLERSKKTKTVWGRDAS